MTKGKIEEMVKAACDSHFYGEQGPGDVAYDLVHDNYLKIARAAVGMCIEEIRKEWDGMEYGIDHELGFGAAIEILQSLLGDIKSDTFSNAEKQDERSGT